MPPKRKYVNSSTRAQAVAMRYSAFERAFDANGGNQTQAAIEAGYSPHSAKSMGSQLATKLNLSRAASEGRAAAFKNAQLSSESVLEELRRIVHSDIRKAYNGDKLKAPHELDDETASAVSSIDIGDDGSSKLRMHDKLVAIDRAMKHLGLFERDNRQKENNLTIQVGLIAAPARKED